MIYKASLDKLAKGVTVLVGLLFAFIVIAPFFFMQEQNKLISILSSVTFLIIFALVFALRPIHYVLEGGQVIVHRPFKDVVIQKGNIASVELADDKRMRGTIRTFGVGGLFGYFGKFSNSEFGNMTWYATRRDQFIILTTTESKKIILTPDEPDAFLKSYHS